MNRFSIGYNFDFEGFILLLEKYKSSLESVYLPLPKKYLGSGRILDEPPDYDHEFIKLLKILNLFEIKPFILLNSTIITAKQTVKVVDFVKELYDKNYIKHATVTDPTLIKELKSSLPDIFIEASTLCRIKTVEEAKYFKEMGVDRITPDREIIRDIKQLKKLKAILPIKLLANEGCIKNCINRYSHYNMLSLNNMEEPFFAIGKKAAKIKSILSSMDSFCIPTIKKHPYKFFSAPFIRPEDLKYYENITDIFKLSTRNFDTLRIDKTLHACINQTFDGNLVEILNSVYIDAIFDEIDNKKLPSDFFKKLSTCDDICDKCDYCKKLMKNVKLKASI